jgi:tetratricopeptide (TPR) repeat protein
MKATGAARCVVLAALVTVSGCAAKEAHFASKFVKPGEPTASYDDPTAKPAPPAQSLQDYARKLRTLQSKAVPRNSFLPTIESTNPELSRALVLLAMHESAENHRLAAAAYRHAGVSDFAFRHYQRAVALEPCDAVSYDGMARVWRDWGMPELALSDVHRALYCNQKSAEIYNTLGTILQALGQGAGAHHAYESAVTLDPNAAFALNNLCYLEMSAGDVGRATAFCERALAAAPDLAAARNNLALIRARDGDLAGAEAGLRAGTVTGTALYNVGVMRLSEGRYAEAAQIFDRASAVDPRLTIARRRYVQARIAAMTVEQPQ